MLPADGFQYSVESISVCPYKPDILDKELALAAPQGGFSRETELRKLLQETRTKLFPQSANYNNSWLQSLEHILNIYKLAIDALKQLKQAIRTKWNGRTYSKSIIIFEEGEIEFRKGLNNKVEVPAENRIILLNQQLEALYKSCHSMIDDLEDECLGRKFEKLFKKFGDLKSDDKRIGILKFYIEQALEAIKTYLPILESDAKQFNYDAYFTKLSEMHEKQFILEAKVGQPEGLINIMSKRFNAAAGNIGKWFKDNNPTFIQIDSTIETLKHLGRFFFEDTHSVFNAVSTSATARHIQSDENASTFPIPELVQKINSMQQNPTFHEYLSGVKTMLDYFFKIEQMLKELKIIVNDPNLARIRQYLMTLHGKQFKVPPFESNFMIEKNRITMIQAIDEAWESINKLCYGEDANQLYSKIELIPLQMKVSGRDSRSLELMITQVTVHHQKIESLFIALKGNLSNELVHHFHTATEARNFDTWKKLKETPLTDWIKELNNDIWKNIIRKSNILLLKSIEKSKIAKENMFITQTKLLNDMASLFDVELDEKHSNPSIEKDRKSVVFDLPETVDTEEFDNKHLEKRINEKIELIDSRIKMTIERIANSPDSLKPALDRVKLASEKTKSTLNALIKIVNNMFNMYDRLKLNWSKLQKDCFKELQSFDLKLDGGFPNNLKYPDKVTLKEVKDKRRKMIENMRSGLDKLKPLCNGNIHKQLLKTVGEIKTNNIPIIMKDIDLKNIDLKYNEFMEIIQNDLNIKYLNVISAIRTTIEEYKTKPHTMDTFEAAEKTMMRLIGDFREADVDLNNKIQNAKQIISEIEVIEVLGKINEALLDKMGKNPAAIVQSSEIDPDLRRAPTQLPKPNEPEKKLLKAHGPLYIHTGGEKQPDFSNDNESIDDYLIEVPLPLTDVELKTKKFDKKPESGKQSDPIAVKASSSGTPKPRATSNIAAPPSRTAAEHSTSGKQF